MLRIARLFALVLLTVFIGNVASADIVSINLTHTVVAGLAASDVAGVEAARNWNNIVSGSQTGTTTLNNLVDQTGAATASSVTTFNRFWRDGVNTSSPNHRMMSGYTNTSTTTNDLISITGLGAPFTTKGYDVIVYLGGTNNMGPDTSIEIAANIDGGANQWIKVWRRDPLYIGSFASTTFATEELAQSSGTESNYIRFSGLTAANFDLNILKDPDSTELWSRASVHGIQIMSLPEPSTFGCLGVMGLAAVFYRKRKR